ncbi:hypothetical protein JCM3765_004816 [Sporobolomyces pararoseus]
MSNTCLLTVGSTQFPFLVSALLSPRLISTLASSLNIKAVYAQIGHSALPTGFSIGIQRIEGVQVEITRFANDLEERVGGSDLVISHAGAGSILSFLRPPLPSSSSSKSKERRLILVPNDTLMDSHQSDLADEMEKKGWATICRDSHNLLATIADLAASQMKNPPLDNDFPKLDERKVQTILDETLGYV